MKQAYQRWINEWERRLACHSTNRVVRPFEWGLDWTAGWPCAQRMPRNGHDPESYLRLMNREMIAGSDEFFGYQPPADFRLENRPSEKAGPAPKGAPSAILRFTSAVRTPYPENNIVHGQWFPAKNKKKAVVVVPHWNASIQQHNALARGLSALGISALRLSLPYHDYRMPPELERADYAVSSNIARTIDATRQAVIDIRSAADWLFEQGFESVGLVGTSLGSCYAFLASAHDERLRVNVFNHCSTYVADVVWAGLSTRHIREGLESHIDLDRLREAWRAISPPSYSEKFAAKKKKSLFLYTKYDTTFPPELSAQVIEEARRLKWDHKVVVLPCGHYTLGESPFKFIDGYHICSFLKRNL
ncbi:MAG: abhydrolase domain-containing 18 [Bryobacteraceae bacterium]